MLRRLARLIAAAALQLVALVLAHQLVYLARYGSRYGEELVHSGHGDAWSAAVATSLVLGVGLAVLAALRLGHLGLLLRRRDTNRDRAARKLEPRPLLRAFVRIAPRLVVASVVLLTVQENIERGLIGQGLPGVGILLTPEYAGGLWITIAAGLGVAFVAALFQWRHEILVARLRASRPRHGRAGRAPAARPAIVDRPIESLLGRRSALRAPPLGAAS